MKIRNVKIGTLHEPRRYFLESDNVLSVYSARPKTTSIFRDCKVKRNTKVSFCHFHWRQSVIDSLAFMAESGSKAHLITNSFRDRCHLVRFRCVLSLFFGLKIWGYEKKKSMNDEKIRSKTGTEPKVNSGGNAIKQTRQMRAETTSDVWIIVLRWFRQLP